MSSELRFINARITGIGINPTDYHATHGQRGDAKFSMSPSTLRSFAQCPARWMSGYDSPDSESKEWGRLIDCLVLTPGEFSNRYAVQPALYPDEKLNHKPWNNNATVCRKWRKEQEPREIITAIEHANARVATEKIRADEILCAFVDQSDKQVWVSGEWKCADGMIVPVQCLIDLVPRLDSEFAKCLADLKTTRNASPRAWQRWSSLANYHVQAAFDLDLYCAATGEDRNTWCFVVQENFTPWQTGRRMLTPSKLDIGRKLYQLWLDRYCRCLSSGIWTGYDDHPEAVQGWTMDDAMPGDEYDVMSAMMEAAQASAQELPEAQDEEGLTP